MNRSLKFLLFTASCAVALHCAKKPVNIEKPFVEQVVAEFTEERLAYYLHGGSPKPNSEILEKVLSRHSVKFFEFKPVLRRFYPEIHTRLLGG
jgi:hypothetical protein